jgi:hypothetical protein
MYAPSMRVLAAAAALDPAVVPTGLFPYTIAWQRTLVRGEDIGSAQHAEVECIKMFLVEFRSERISVDILGHDENKSVSAVLKKPKYANCRGKQTIGQLDP